MSELNSKPSNTDELLAAFTDQALGGENLSVKLMIPEGDMELRVLAETVLRIKSAFHGVEVSEAESRRVYSGVMAAWKNIQHENDITTQWLARLKKVFAPKNQWRSQKSRQKLGVTLAFAMTAVLLFIAAPFLSGVIQVTPGSAGTNTAGIATLVIAIILAAAAIWWAARKG